MWLSMLHPLMWIFHRIPYELSQCPDLAGNLAPAWNTQFHMLIHHCHNEDLCHWNSPDLYILLKNMDIFKMDCKTGNIKYSRLILDSIEDRVDVVKSTEKLSVVSVAISAFVGSREHK